MVLHIADGFHKNYVKIYISLTPMHAKKGLWSRVIVTLSNNIVNKLYAMSTNHKFYDFIKQTKQK